MEKKHSHLLKNKKLIVYKKDVKIEPNDKLFKNVDCVFHLAAIADIVPSIVNPREYYDKCKWHPKCSRGYEI